MGRGEGDLLPVGAVERGSLIHHIAVRVALGVEVPLLAIGRGYDRRRFVPRGGDGYAWVGPPLGQFLRCCHADGLARRAVGEFIWPALILDDGVVGSLMLLDYHVDGRHIAIRACEIEELARLGEGVEILG